MKYIYLFILCTIFALVISFKNYKKEAYDYISAKEAPLKFLYGFSFLLENIFAKISKSKTSDNLVTKLKSISFGLCAFTIIIFFGFLFCVTSTSSKAKTPDKNLESTKESTLTILENESTDNIITETTSYDVLKDTIAIFESYRKGIESEFLAENSSYYSITKPLNLIKQYGPENIVISWSFETENVIDEAGNIIYENIDETGCSTLAYATLTLNDISATLTIPIFISPP